MAEAMITGLIKSGHRRSNIMVCAPSNETRQAMVKNHHINVSRENEKAVLFADVYCDCGKTLLGGRSM